MQIIAPSQVYPVIVIGSGASGGMAAWNLTSKGIDVLVLDAGDRFERRTFWTHVRPWEARERNARGEYAPRFFLDTREQPYITPDARPFDLYRVLLIDFDFFNQQSAISDQQSAIRNQQFHYSAPRFFSYSSTIRLSASRSEPWRRSGPSALTRWTTISYSRSS
jgi:glycine/D-amino acid oxidase-like deaminating enzyme